VASHPRRIRAPIPSTTICTQRALDWPTSSEAFGRPTKSSLNCRTPGASPGFSFGTMALKIAGGRPQVIAYVVAWALFAPSA
jgi:hypothetical protein